MHASRPLYGFVVERRAQSIRDPIERLRFLKGSVDSRAALYWKRRVRSRRWLIASASTICCLAAAALGAGMMRAPAFNPRELARSRPDFAAVPGSVWLVERKDGVELYSNGLRVDNRYATSNRARSYQVFQSHAAGFRPVERRNEPAGIVFHTTESLLAPFAAGYNHMLQRLGQELLVYVRARRSYHFLIDRFGRVYRVVSESDSANHAGHSVWADERWRYINLNQSFLSVSFETQTQSGGKAPTINSAQIHAGRVLTEMLRSKYGIAARNCVTHAQVSVNAGNMLVGYHTDWAANFPFAQLGLPDNYGQPLPSLYAFGFEYDFTYLEATGMPIWEGLLLAEERLRRDALSQGRTMDDYRRLLRRSYRSTIAASQPGDAHKESD
jgi:hypothetical protein